MVEPATRRRIVLASRPKGAPVPENFRLEESPIPDPAEGEVLTQVLWASIDPYMRGRMNEGPSYATPVAIGGVMGGGTVGRVIASKHAGFAPGDLVLGHGGWQTHAVEPGTELMKLDPGIKRPSYALGVLGMPGYTAWHGLLEIGRPRPGETVVVSAATGAVGAVAGQLAKRAGARVVGIAGGAEKCRFALEELRLDACLDHRRDDLPKALAAACPDGIDVYFENVGGKLLDAVLPLLNREARIPLCGIIAQYNMDRLPEGPDTRPVLLSTLLRQRARLEGFIISDHWHRFPAFLARMTPLVESGQIRYREDVVDGLDNTVAAFIGLLEGRNFGKLVVRVSDQVAVRD
ncbi:MAG TPA: NADP-dependent oxidoreductase [Hyphomicrobiaceae bacterium]|nr:NADP-dependent oxidoreductase [Hyphomicrobiaceae bacterium]